MDVHLVQGMVKVKVNVRFRHVIMACDYPILQFVNMYDRKLVDQTSLVLQVLKVSLERSAELV